MELIYKHVGITRQGYFQAKKRLEKTEKMMNEVDKLVKEYRAKKDRRAGSRSLYYNLGIKTKYNIGVSKFERLMSDFGLTLAPLRVRVVTTKSDYKSMKYKDLAAGLEIDNINQLVVGDLTYISIGKDFYYLFCLTDVYSARIVGHHLGRRMRAIEAEKARDKWLKLRSGHDISGCIHHSDGGSQYFAKSYITPLVKKLGVKISVAKNCLDNGYAEQKNGFFKHHLIPTINLNKTKNLNNAIEKLIYFYNHERKQEELGWLSPIEYEQKWANKDSRPVLKLYDRSKKERSKRGFSQVDKE